MKKSKNEQSYRASVWAIIIDDKYNFLLVKLLSETKDKYDFVKWWMKVQENYEDTIKREISVINFYKKEKIRIEIQKNLSNREIFLVINFGCGDRNWTCDLRVMSPTRYHFSTPLKNQKAFQDNSWNHFFNGMATGNRTPVAGMKTRCPNH